MKITSTIKSISLSFKYEKKQEAKKKKKKSLAFTPSRLSIWVFKHNECSAINLPCIHPNLVVFILMYSEHQRGG
jgi:hypothetical protein